MQPTREEKEALIGLFCAARFTEALAAARAMAQRSPTALDAWNIRGASARELGYLDEAELSFRELERLAPNFAGAPYNLGLVLEDKGCDQDAVLAYRRALALDRDLAQGHNNLGSVLMRLGELEAAHQHLKRATQLQPGRPEVHNSFGNVLKRLDRIEEAREAYRRAIKAQPGFAKAHYNLGVLESDYGPRSQAIEAFRAALTIEPDNALARAMLLHELSHCCDWDAMAEHERFIPNLGVETQAVPPFIMLALEDNPAHQLARSRKWARARYGHIKAESPAFARPKVRPQRLRVGYFSADFHDHPGARLIGGVMREHDRARFEVHAISYGKKRADKWRAISEASVDVFHDIHGWADADVQNLLRALKLDCAIDRQGYTTDARTDWFARRFAPVQINYLGYCSTMAADFIDYMIADKTVIPHYHRAHYLEKMIYLPNTYVPADNQLEIAATHSQRSDHGLPDDAFVFCCFNNLYKITPRVFAIWLRALRSVDKSVLWLFGSNEAAQSHLRAAAKAQGVDPNRLIFAKRVPNADHLERHAHADLFVDTAPYNAHTTANDALWAGLPVVTRRGEQFAARVAASLLSAVGLPELITHSDEEYEALILNLARDEGKRQAIRAKLAEARGSAPLFNTTLYTRQLEAGFDAAYERFRMGQSPADITVAS